MTKKFFERSSVVVAESLIGCFLCTGPTSLKLHGINQKIQKYMIVETESYGGFVDKASHSSRGETKRNTVMWGPPSRWYVYFTYGLHYMLNIVCGLDRHPAAVLIRGVVSENGKEKFLGPAILTKKLGIDKSFNNRKATRATGLWIEHTQKINGRRKLVYSEKLKILRTPRIGVDYAGPVWSKKNYRFVLYGFETKKFKKPKV